MNLKCRKLGFKVSFHKINVYRYSVDPGVAPYDYLLDQFERGMTEERLSEIFGELRASLVPVIAKTLAAPPLHHPEALTGLAGGNEVGRCTSWIQCDR